MTEQNLRSLVNKLNRGTKDGLIFLRPLSDQVDFAKVWKSKPNPDEGISYSGPTNFYFIKDPTNKYVGAVEDRTNDLHWFMLTKHRGKGLMKKSLKTAILPHLFLDRNEQRITIQESAIGKKNFLSSENLALTLGFKKTMEGIVSEYLLSGTSFSGFHLKPIELTVSETRMEEMQKRINFLSKQLWLIQTEVEMNLPDFDYAEELKELVEEIQNQAFRLEDKWWYCKNEAGK